MHAGRAQEQGITKGDGLERCTSNIVDGIGRLGQRLILHLHDHRGFQHMEVFTCPDLN